MGRGRGEREESRRGVMLESEGGLGKSVSSGIRMGMGRKEDVGDAGDSVRRFAELDEGIEAADRLSRIGCGRVDRLSVGGGGGRGTRGAGALELRAASGSLIGGGL